MTVRLATRDYQKAQVALRAYLYTEVQVLWRSLDPTRLDDTFPKFVTGLLDVIDHRRDLSAELARHYLTNVRVGVEGVAPIIPTPPLSHPEAMTALRVTSVIAIKIAMTKGTPLRVAASRAMVRTMGAADKLVADAGRTVIRESVRLDPEAEGWVRRTLGTCEFCQELAAEEDLQPGHADFERHDHCGCQPEPVYDSKLKAEESFVQKIMGMLAGDKSGSIEKQLRAIIADVNTQPLSRLNAETALERHTQAKVANEAVLAAEKQLAAVRAAEGIEMRASADAYLSSEQYRSLAPERAWSAEKRESILTALRGTPEGRVLADTLERFQDGGSIARLRTKIDSYLAGVPIDATSQARADALLNAIRNSPDWAPDTLYRGMSVKGKLENVLAKYVEGDTLDLNLTSFSADRSVAKRFQEMTSGAGGSTKVMVELVGEGKRTIPIQNLPRDKRLFREKEWVSAGKYEIVSVKKSAGTILLRIRQVGTL